MTKYEKKGLIIGILTLLICIIFSIFFAFYLLIPKDKINKSIKNYYIDSFIFYYLDNEDETVTLDDLIKKGYAKKHEELTKNSCDYKTSYINKENKIITLNLKCKIYTKEYKIVFTEEK